MLSQPPPTTTNYYYPVVDYILATVYVLGTMPSLVRSRVRPTLEFSAKRPCM
jgi:hypothetical protein